MSLANQQNPRKANRKIRPSMPPYRTTQYTHTGLQFSLWPQLQALNNWGLRSLRWRWRDQAPFASAFTIAVWRPFVCIVLGWRQKAWDPLEIENMKEKNHNDFTHHTDLGCDSPPDRTGTDTRDKRKEDYNQRHNCIIM